ncbi:MAG: NAD(P)H-quinone oxidoreductase [Aquisalimonadaceae bacterium]
MRAWRITAPGEPDVLRLETMAEPAFGPSDVRIRVHGAGLNRADLLQRRGIYPAPPGAIADVPGLEYAGVVEAVGDKVLDRKPGDRVMGLTLGGAYAEQVVVHERETIRIPEGMDMARAAALPEAFLTAYRAIFLEGGLQAGQWCLIRAATSGIGLAAAQLVKAFAGHTIGTSRSAERLEKIKANGLDVALVDGQQPLAESVREVTGGGAHVILDLVGGKGNLNENLKALRPEGTQVVVGIMAGPKDEIDIWQLLLRRLTLRAMTMRSLPLERRIGLARMFEDRLLGFFENGILAPVVDTVLPFEEAVQAHTLMEAGSHTGKIVLLRGD